MIDMQVALPHLLTCFCHKILSLWVQLTFVLFDLMLLERLARDYQTRIVVRLCLHHHALLDLSHYLVQLILMSILSGRKFWLKDRFCILQYFDVPNVRRVKFFAENQTPPLSLSHFIVRLSNCGAFSGRASTLSHFLSVHYIYCDLCVSLVDT